MGKCKKKKIIVIMTDKDFDKDLNKEYKKKDKPVT
jgi:ssRNA-specific RNase YbeY (16S rRNA maturation enzyme)